MKFKAGDMAVTFGAPMDNGLLVEVLAVNVMTHPEALHHIKSLGSPFHMTPATCSADCYWPASMLRPIRDPGDDAQDETLAWKPVPLPVIQPELLDA